MKNLKLYLVLVLLLMCGLAFSQKSIMTFNIRYNNPDDKENWWEHRKPELLNLIQKYQPSVLGLQEVLKDQVDYIHKNLSNYAYVGVGRDDGKTKGEFAPIFYDQDLLVLLDYKTYWLSETPDTISVGWDASMERIVTYAVFKDKLSKDTCYVFNAHFDHIGEKAQEMSATLILKLIEDLDLNEKRVVVMGDLNVEPESNTIELLKTQLEDAFELSNILHTGPEGTFNRFDETKTPILRIDYIFTRNISLKSYQNINNYRSNGLCISDHLPVTIAL